MAYHNKDIKFIGQHGIELTPIQKKATITNKNYI